MKYLKNDDTTDKVYFVYPPYSYIGPPGVENPPYRYPWSYLRWMYPIYIYV